jgi:hypothetical protein
MKLFVWHDSLADYSPGVMFALANDVDEARAIILASVDLPTVRRDLKAEPAIYDSPVGFTCWGGS